MREIVIGHTYQFIMNHTFGFSNGLIKHDGEFCKVIMFSIYDCGHNVYQVQFSDGEKLDVFDVELFTIGPNYKLLDSISRIRIM